LELPPDQILITQHLVVLLIGWLSDFK